MGQKRCQFVHGPTSGSVLSGCDGSATQTSESRLTRMSDTSWCHGPSSTLTRMLLGPRPKVVMGPDRTRQACAEHTVEACRGRHRAEEATTQSLLGTTQSVDSFPPTPEGKNADLSVSSLTKECGWLHFPETVRKKSADRKHGRHPRHGN